MGLKGYSFCPKRFESILCGVQNTMPKILAIRTVMSAIARDMTKKLVTERSRRKQTTAVTTSELPARHKE